MTDSLEELQRKNRVLEEEIVRLKAHPQVNDAKLDGDGAIALGQDALAVGVGGTSIRGGVSGIFTQGDANQFFQNSNVTIVVTPEGPKEFIGGQPVEMTAVKRESALGRYLEHIIAHNRYLQLQGIRSGGKLVNIELEQIYITLKASQRANPGSNTQQHASQTEMEWLREEAGFAPGEQRKQTGNEPLRSETVNVRVEQALASHKHLVILGDPGSGKTTLTRYLALLYGRDLALKSKSVKAKFGLNESGHLPVLLQLRQMGTFLKAHFPDDGTDGQALMLAFLRESLKKAQIDLPTDFFDPYLDTGKAVILLDGLDEVADPALRRRVSRLVEAFVLAHPACRFVVTSRVVGYNDSVRLGGDFSTSTVRDFTLEDVGQFLKHWHRLVAVGQIGIGVDAENFAASQTTQLMSAIRDNERVRELAINPLMLTVIALVHRDRVKLPDRRAELYAEAVDVLLGKWDEARGVGEVAILDDRPFDAGDRRLLLQTIALSMHERQKKELEAVELRALLQKFFTSKTLDESAARRAAEHFLTVVEERTGLLSARGEGIYAFSHLTFQEYLAALEIAGRDDYATYVLEHCAEPWWREVILLTAGSLSAERTTKLIKAIADKKKEPAPYHNLVLAAECLRDVGSNRVQGDLQSQVQARLYKNLNTAMPVTARWFGKLGLQNWVERRAEVVQALARVGSGYWTMPYGEPEWVNIPAGEFWMGGEGKYDGEPVHKLYLPEYQIARVPVTNAQYALFIKAANHAAPTGWDENRPPKGKESHPVVNVSWQDALSYCAWLSKVTGKQITLPSEAEWEKAARGDKDKRAYPWGDDFNPARCNTLELGLGDTSPVGIFLEGASPYGLLDMSGNTWELTRTISDGKFNYPYNRDDGREDINSMNESRVLRGGAFYLNQDLARCAYRDSGSPYSRHYDRGFRVSLSRILLS